MLLDRRRSGVLLHPTSLPGPFGIGDLGPARARLPRLPRRCAPVAVAGPAARPDRLRRLAVCQPVGVRRQPAAHLARAADRRRACSTSRILAARSKPAARPRRLRPPGAAQARPVVQTAFQRGRERLRAETRAFPRTPRRLARGLRPVFRARRTSISAPGPTWDDPPARSRSRRACRGARASYAERVDFYVFCQCLFAEQWSAVRARAHALGIGIVGDIPIFVAHDSADVWAQPAAVQARRRRPAAGRRRRAAGLLQRHRPALGQPALRLGSDGCATAIAGGSSASGTCSSWSTWCGSTTSAASRPPGK